MPSPARTKSVSLFQKSVTACWLRAPGSLKLQRSWTYAPTPLQQIVLAFAQRHGVQSFADLEPFEVTPTVRQRRMVEQAAGTFAAAWAKVFTGDKFGQATTHWAKLEQRLRRGVGNPCPLLLVGIPATSIRSEETP